MTENIKRGLGNHECLGKLDTYLDGELNTSDMQQLDGHLRECPACTVEVLRRLQWKRAVHSAGQAYTADPAFRTRIQKSISPAPRWWSWRPALAAVTAALLLFAGATIFERQIIQPNRNSAQEARMTSELADLHVATLASLNPVDVISSDRHNVKPWFAGKIPFTFDLPELQGTEFELLGGRVAYMEQSPGAQLLFRVRKHQISVFIFQSKALPQDFAQAQEVNARSFHLETWQHNGLQYFAISDVAPEDLSALSNLLQK